MMSHVVTIEVRHIIGEEGARDQRPCPLDRAIAEVLGVTAPQVLSGFTHANVCEGGRLLCYDFPSGEAQVSLIQLINAFDAGNLRDAQRLLPITVEITPR